MRPYSRPSTGEDADQIPAPPQMYRHNQQGAQCAGGAPSPPQPPGGSGIMFHSNNTIPIASNGRDYSSTTTTSSSSSPLRPTMQVVGSMDGGLSGGAGGGAVHDPPPYNYSPQPADGGNSPPSPFAPPQYQPSPPSYPTSGPPQYVASKYINLPDVMVPPPSYRPPTRVPPPSQLQDSSIIESNLWNEICPVQGKNEIDVAPSAPPPYSPQAQPSLTLAPLICAATTPFPSSAGFRPLPTFKKPSPSQQQQQQQLVAPTVTAVSKTVTPAPTAATTSSPPSLPTSTHAPVSGFRPLPTSKKPSPLHEQQEEHKPSHHIVLPVVAATLPLGAPKSTASAPHATITPLYLPATTIATVTNATGPLLPTATAPLLPTTVTTPTPTITLNAPHTTATSSSPLSSSCITSNGATSIPATCSGPSAPTSRVVAKTVVSPTGVVAPHRIIVTLPTLPALPDPTDGAPLRTHEFKFEREVDEHFGNTVARIFVPSHLPLQVTSLIDLVAMHVRVGGPLVAAEIQTRERDNPLFAFMMPPPPMSSISLPPPTNGNGGDRWDRETEKEANWKRLVGSILQDPAVVYYRWRLYSLLNGDSCLEWRSAPFVMEVPSSSSSQNQRSSKRGDERGGGEDHFVDEDHSRRPGGGRRERSRSPPFRSRSSTNFNTLVWIPPAPVAPPGAASVFVDTISLVPSSCFLTPVERHQIKEGGKAFDPTNFSRLFCPAEGVRHRRFSDHLATSSASASQWVYPRVEPWRVEHTSSIGWMSRQTTQQQIPHVSVNSFPDPRTLSSVTQTPSSSSSFSHHLQNPIMDVDVDDTLEINILGGTRLRALGQGAPLEEPRCPSRLPSLLSPDDAAIWKGMLDTKSHVKKRCNSLKLSPHSLQKNQQQHAESEEEGVTQPKKFEWSHVVDQYTFLLQDGHDDAIEIGGDPSEIDARDSSFINNILQPTLLDKDAVLSPCILFVLQHHRSPLHVIGLILDEMISLAHLPTSDVFLAIEAGVRDFHQHRMQVQTAISPSNISSLTVSDLLRIKRRIILTHQFGMLFCLFLLQEIVSSVQVYGGSAALSILWKHRPNQLNQQGSSGMVDDGSQSAGSYDGGDGEMGEQDAPDDRLVPCVGLPASFVVLPPTTNKPAPNTILHPPSVGAKRARSEDDGGGGSGGAVVPASHLAGLIRSIEMISTAVIEATIMLAGYDTPAATTTTSSPEAASSNASRVFSKLHQQQKGAAKSEVGVFSGVIVHWLVAIIQGWYSDGALPPPRQANHANPSQPPPPPSLHPLVGLTQRFAVQERVSLPQAKYLSEALLNHPTIKMLLPSQRRRVTLVEKYPFLFY